MYASCSTTLAASNGSTTRATRSTAIAIGGNTLSRGLTLEGLVVSYFVRSATAYDTLLQMGRWFGYRGGYADLPRVWMTEELEEWFRHLAGVEEEIRKDIDRYMQDDVTPETFAVRIRAHPSLAITAAAKMRDAVQVAAAFGGLARPDTLLRRRRRGLAPSETSGPQSNSSQALSEPETKAERRDPKLWRDVDVDAVLDFLDNYQVHASAPDNASRALAAYTRSRNAKGKIRKWNVALIGSSTAGTERVPRRRHIRSPR